ncbi:MAG: hypothetical protein OEM38_05200, partial [Gammaproteobacteria bacterium]|nr:hypothetical protein [Gammaproteobacteria bacterium]
MNNSTMITPDKYDVYRPQQRPLVSVQFMLRFLMLLLLVIFTNNSNAVTVTLHPSGLASNSGAYTVTGGTWADVLDSNDGIASYAVRCCTGPTAEFLVDMDNPVGLSGSVINSITFHAYVSHSAASGVTNIGYMTDGVNTVWKGDTTIPSANTYTLVSSSTYTTDSAGGALDLTDLNNLQISVNRIGVGPANMRVTEVYAVVDYTPGTPVGAIAHWKFDETSGNVAVDSVGNYNGVVTGGAWVAGKSGNGRSMDGTTSQTMVASALNWAPAAFTVEFWINPTKLESWNQQLGATNIWGSFNFHTTSSGVVYVGIKNGSRIQTGSGVLKTNTWQHIVYTHRHNVAQKIYKDGVLIASIASAWPSLAWGGFKASNVEGVLDEVVIYDRALSLAEIQARYNMSIPPPTPPGVETIAGVVRSISGTEFMADGTSVTLAVNGSVVATTAVAGGLGAYSFSGLALSANDKVLVYLSNAVEDGNTVTVSDGTSMSGIDIYQNRVIVRNDNGAGTTTNADLFAARNGLNSADILYTVTSNSLNMGGNTELLIWPDANFTPGGTVNAVHMNIIGTLTAEANAINVSGYWINSATGTGTFVPGTSTVTFNGLAQSIAGSSTFYILNKTTTTADTLTFAAGSTQTIVAGGAITLTGATGQLLSLRSDAASTARWGLTVPDSANKTIQYIDVQDSDVSTSGAAHKPFTPTNSVDSLNNIDWFLVVAGTNTIGGTVYGDEGITNIGPNKTVRLLVNGVSQGTAITDANGAYSMTYSSAAVGDTLLVYIEGDIVNGTTVTVSSGNTLGGFDIYGGRLIVRHDNAGAMTNVLLDAADGTGGNAEILYTLAGNALTVTATTELFIPTGHTFTPGNTIDTIGLDINGTLNAAANAINVSGNWDATGGAFTSTGTVIFDGNSNQTAITNAQAFNNLTLSNTGSNGTADNVIISGVLDVNGILTIADGDLDITTNNPTVNTAGAVSVGAAGSIDVSARTANWTFDGTSILTDASSAGQDFQDVVVNGVSLNLASSVKVHTMTITAGTLHLGTSAYVLELDGTGTPFVNNGTFNEGVSTVKYTGSGMATNIALLPYNSLQLTPTAATTYSLTGNQTISHSLTGTLTIDVNATLDVTATNFALTVFNMVNAGTYLAKGSVINVGADWTNSGTFTAGTSTVTFYGMAQKIFGSTTFYNLNKTVSFPDTLTIAAESTQTIAAGGLVTLKGNATNLLKLRSGTTPAQWNANITQWKFNIDATATKVIEYVDVQDVDASGSAAAHKPINPANSVDSSNNIDWFVVIVGTNTISGTVYSDEGITNLGSNKTVRLLVNGVSQGTAVTDVNGAYSITYSPASAGDKLLVYIEGDIINGTTATVSDGNALAGLDIYGDRLIVRHDNAGVMTNALLDAADGTGGNAEILYSMAGTILTVTAPTELFIPTGHTFTPGNTIDTVGMDINGSLAAAANGINVSGNWDATGGVFTSTGTVTFDGNNNQTVITNAQAFTNLTLNNTGSNSTINNVIISGALDINGVLAITDGGLDITTNNPTVNTAGAVSVGVAGSINVSARTANWTFDGVTVLTDASSIGQDFQDVVVNGTSLSLASNAKMHTMTVTAGALNLGASAYVLELDGTGSPFVNSGTFSAGTSTVKYTGSGIATNIAFLPYSSLQLIPTVATTYSLTGNQTVSQSLTGNLTIDINATLDVTATNFGLTVVNMTNAGTYLAKGSTINVSGDWTNSGTFTAGTSTVTLNGWAQKIFGSNTFYNLNKSVSFPDTLTIAAESTQTIAAGGLVTLKGVAANLLKLRSGTTQAQWNANITQWNLNIDASATKVIEYVDVQDVDASGSATAHKPIDPANSLDSLNNIDWFVVIAGTNTIGGTVYSDEGITHLGSNKTVRLLVNGVSQGTAVTDVNGAYSITYSPASVGDALLIYIEGDTINGTTVTVSDANTLAGLDIYGDRLIVRHDNAGAMTNALLDVADGTVGNAEILYTMTGTTLTVAAATELFIPMGHTFTPGNTIDTIGVDINGTLNAEANAINVSGDWDATGGVFTSTGTVTFDATSGINTITTGGTDVNHDFYNIVFSDAVGTATFQLAGAIDVDGNFTVIDGIVDTTAMNHAITVRGNLAQAVGQVEANASIISVAGHVTLNGAIDNTDYSNSTLVLNGVANQMLISGNAILNNLTLNNTGANGTADNVIVSGSLDVDGALTITDGDFDIATNNPSVNTAGSVSVGVAGSINVTARTANWTFDGATVLTDASAGQSFQDVIVNGVSLSLASNAKVHTMRVTAGTLSLGDAGYVLELDGTGTLFVNNGTFSAGTSTVKYTGSGVATNIALLPYSSLQLTPIAATTYSLTGSQTLGNALTGNLIIDTNATLDATATNFGLTAVNMTNAGKYLAKASAINVSGNWSNTGTFTAATSTVTLNGAGLQSVITGGSVFTNLTVTNASSEVIFADAFTTTNFTAITANTQLTFTGGLIYTVSGTLNVNGRAPGTKVVMRSTSLGSQYVIDVTGGAQSVKFVDVGNSVASSFDITAINSTNSGNNDDAAASPRWVFITVVNKAPLGGYVADNVIPSTQVVQASDGSGNLTIRWKAKDAESDLITLKTFQYSDDAGVSWFTPNNADNSLALSSNWDVGVGYTSAETFATADEFSFTFNTQHADVAAVQSLSAMDQADVRVRFTLNDGALDSVAPVISDSIQVDNLSPPVTFISGVYNGVSDTFILTGTNFTSIAPVAADITSVVNWNNIVWDLNGDNGSTADISFVASDVMSLVVTDDTTLTLILTSEKATFIEGDVNFSVNGGTDTLDFAAGFSRDVFGNVSLTDAKANAPLTIISSSTISGIVYLNEGVTNIGPGKTVHLLVNGVSIGTALTNSVGRYSINALVTANDVLLLYIDNDSLYSGVTVSVTNGRSFSSYHIFADHLIVRHDNGGNLSNELLGAAIGSYSDSDIIFNTNINNLSVTGDNSVLYIPVGQTFAPGGNISTSHLNIAGGLNAGDAIISVSGDWINNGMFIPGASSVMLTGATQSILGSSAFYNLSKVSSTQNTKARSKASIIPETNSLAKRNQAATSNNALYFSSGSSTWIQNNLQLKGEKGHKMNLASTIGGRAWNLNIPVGVEYTASNLNIQDCNVWGIDVLEATDSIDLGGNNHLKVSGPGLSVQTVIGEITPSAVTTNTLANHLRLSILPTISTDNSGIDLVTIRFPSEYTNLLITDVSIENTALAVNCPAPALGQYCAANVNNTLTVTLGDVLLASVPIHVSVDVDAPASQISSQIVMDVTNVEAITPPVDVVAGNADGIEINDNTLSLETIGFAGPEHSSFIASPQVVAADGVAVSILTATTRDASNKLLREKTVTLSSSRPSDDNLIQPSTATNRQGFTSGSISSSTLGASIITATDVTDGVEITQRARVYFNQGQVLQLAKTVNKNEAIVGDVLTYQIEIRNTTTDAVVGVKLDDRLPSNFKYVAGSARLNDATTVAATGNETKRFSIGNVPALVDTNGNGQADEGEQGYVVLSYQLIVSAGATPRVYVNEAVAVDLCDICFISNRAKAEVDVVIDSVFDLGTIIGKVFEDSNKNNYQDPNEPGIAGAMVVLDDGISVLTDQYGRYHFPSVKPGQRLVKIDLNSVSASATTELFEARVVSSSPGLLSKQNFGIQSHLETKTIGQDGENRVPADVEKQEFAIDSPTDSPIDAAGSINSSPYLNVKLPPENETWKNPRFPVSGQTDVLNTVVINGQSIETDDNGYFSTLLPVHPGSNTLLIEVKDPQGQTGKIERQIDVAENQMFFLAFADGEVGLLQGSGLLPSGKTGQSREVYTEGRLAYYLKGTIKGKYLITSALDTGRQDYRSLFKDLDSSETDRLLTNIDPEKAYPVYGDDS